MIDFEKELQEIAKVDRTKKPFAMALPTNNNSDFSKSKASEVQEKPLTLNVENTNKQSGINILPVQQNKNLQQNLWN